LTYIGELSYLYFIKQQTQTAMNSTMNINGKDYQVTGISIKGTAGNYIIEAEINGEWYDGFTHNANLKDDFNETDDYFQDDTSGHWYESAEQVNERIVKLIVEQNNL